MPDDVKSRRHIELRDLYREHAQELNQREIGTTQLVLIEGVRLNNVLFFYQKYVS